MGMMAKMRSLAPWFILSVGGLFVLFMVISDSSITDIMQQRTNNVGYIEDETVTYQDFSQMVERARVQQVNQLGNDLDEQQMDMLRDQVWDALVTQKLIQDKIDEFNIQVTDEEISDAILGPNPPDFLRMNFIDSTGQFNRQAYEQALFNPQNREALVQAEEAVRQQILQQKLQNYLDASIMVSDADLKRAFQDQSIKFDANYAFVGVNSISDSAASVTENDIEEYYRKNKEKYKVVEQRSLKYVLFEKSAMDADSSVVLDDLNAIVRESGRDTSGFKTSVEIYSDIPFSVDTLAINQLDPAAVDSLQNAKPGRLVGPILTNRGYVIYNYKNKLKSDQTYVNAAHILVRGDGAEAEQKAEEVYNKVQQGADFSELATNESMDPGSAARGGSLGWFSKGQMVPEFEKVAFGMKIGSVSKPVKTQFGYHIIKLLGKSNSKFVVSILQDNIEPSATTVDIIYNNANDFAYLADKNSFEDEAELLGYNVVETPTFVENAGAIPGLGVSKAIVKFAFENDPGEISDVFKVPSGYAVVKVAERIKPGYRDLEEVKDQITAAVRQQKKLSRTLEIAKQIKDKVGDDGDLQTAKEVYPAANYNSVNNMTPNANIATIGRDYAFLGYALEAEIGKISPALKGNRGSFLIKVTRRTEPDSATFALQKEVLRENLLQQKRNRFFTEWIAELKDEADIVDERYKFYR